MHRVYDSLKHPHIVVNIKNIDYLSICRTCFEVRDTAPRAIYRAMYIHI